MCIPTTGFCYQALVEGCTCVKTFITVTIGTQKKYWVFLNKQGMKVVTSSRAFFKCYVMRDLFDIDEPCM